MEEQSPWLSPQLRAEARTACRERETSLRAPRCATAGARASTRAQSQRESHATVTTTESEAGESRSRGGSLRKLRLPVCQVNSVTGFHCRCESRRQHANYFRTAGDSSWRSSISAGPSVTKISGSSANTTRGIIILVDVLAAASSARRRRSVRNASE